MARRAPLVLGPARSPGAGRSAPTGRSRRSSRSPECPSGLGWLPDGRLLVVSMHDRRLLRLDPDGLTEVADLSELATWHCNDMVVDAVGRAYIGNFGFDLDGGGRRGDRGRSCASTPTARLQRRRGRHPLPERHRHHAGRRDADRGGELRRMPDRVRRRRRRRACRTGGCGRSSSARCRTASASTREGAIWSACPLTGRVLRVREGGEVTDEVRGEPQRCLRVHARWRGPPDAVRLRRRRERSRRRPATSAARSRPARSTSPAPASPRSRPRSRFGASCHPADSSCGRDELVEALGGSIPAEGLAGSAVEAHSDLVEVGLGVEGEVGAFGEVLADEAVPVLVGAPLPG